MSIREYVPLAPLTTFKIGGMARYFVEVHNVEELPDIYRFAHVHALPIFLLGGGSNILMSDEGFPGLVITLVTKNFKWSTSSDKHKLLTVDAGFVWDDVVALAVKNNCWGIENLSLIPGTVGGALVQNIGAYGVEVSEVIHSVEIFDASTGTTKTLLRDACHFGYRDSFFKHEGKHLLITRATFRLSVRPKPNIMYKDLATFFLSNGKITPTLSDIRSAVMRIRTSKFPLLSEIGTAGSFFKNPVVTTAIAKIFLSKYPSAPNFVTADGLVKLSAGWIIDHVLHMRGVRNGNVGCWNDQALVIVNYSGATCSEVKNFVTNIQEKCFATTKIKLFSEVIFVDAKTK